MPNSTPAVFLSYASQDVVAAERIADALNAAGIEVWFDKSELVGGDAWDQKIRGQIGSCALFVPLISATTQARHEGYFRLEWKLAVDRTHLMAEDHPFLFPVVVDDTTDGEARVPSKFREHQWMRMQEDGTPEAIAQRVAQVLSGEPAATSGSVPTASPIPAVRPADPQRGRGKRPPFLMPAIAAAIMALGLFFWQPWQGSDPSIPAENSTSAPAPGSEAARLLEDAWTQLNDQGLSKVELDRADELLSRANQLDPDSADIWAAWSQVDTWMSYHNFDDSAELRQSASHKIEEALRRAPASFEVRLAQAFYNVRIGGGTNSRKSHRHLEIAEPVLKELLQERPAEPRALFTLAILQRNLGRTEEAIRLLEELAKNPDWSAIAWSEVGWIHYLWGPDWPAALEAVDRSIALHPYWGNIGLKMYVSMYWTGDLDAMQESMNRLDHISAVLDWGVYRTHEYYRYRRQPNRAIQFINTVAQDWLSSNAFEGPTRMLAGQAHELAGREAAARVEYEGALREVETRLAANPSEAELHRVHGTLLVSLNRMEEATQAFQLYYELRGVSLPEGEDPIPPLLAGDWDQVISDLEADEASKSRWLTAARLQLDPSYDPLREMPRFQRLLARLESDPFFSPLAKAPPAASDGSKARVEVSIPAKSIAILPFANRSVSADDTFFVDGIHDDLITHISRIKDLKSIARSSVMGYRDTTKALKQIGDELGVATVLQGGVQRAGNRVRINVQLSDAATDDHLWAESFTRELTAENIFDIQTEIATAVATALKVVLSSTEQQHFEKLPTENLAALEAYFRGKQELEKYSSEGLEAALPHYQEAIRLDPKFADAYAGLARVYTHQPWFGNESMEGSMAEAKEHIDQALELNPNLPDAWIELGHYLANTSTADEAEPAFLRAIELGPNTVNAYKGYGGFLQWHRRDIPHAITVLRQAVAVDPRDVGALNMLADALIVGYQHQEAREILERTIHYASERTSAYRSLGELQANAFNRYDLAIKAYRQALELSPGTTHLIFNIAEGHNKLGDGKRQLQWLGTMLQRPEYEDDYTAAMRAYYQYLKYEDEAAHASARLVPPSSYWYPGAISVLFATSASVDEKRGWLTALTDAFPDEWPLENADLFNCFVVLEMHHRLGNTEEVHALAQKVLANFPANPAARWQNAQAIVMAHAFAGEPTEAVRQLRHFADEGAIFNCTPGMRDDWGQIAYDALQNEPGFLELVAIMDERLAKQRANLERWEANGELAPLPVLTEDGW